MINLRVEIEKDLFDSIESEWGMPVELTTPDGQTQIYSANNPSEKLKGQILYFTRRENPTTGEQIIVREPVVSLRISSLIRVPAAGENWFIKFPVSPRPGAEMKSFLLTTDRSPEDGTDIGFARFYPQKILQESEPVS